MSSRRRPHSRSASPPRRRGAASPPRKHASPPRRRATSPPRERLASPPRKRLSSPPRKRSRSPPRKHLASPPRERAVAAAKDRSCSAVITGSHRDDRRRASESNSRSGSPARKKQAIDTNDGSFTSRFGDGPSGPLRKSLPPTVNPNEGGPSTQGQTWFAVVGDFNTTFAGTLGLNAQHDIDPDDQAVETTAMDFSKLDDFSRRDEVSIPKNLVEYLMTQESKVILRDETSCNVEFNANDSKVRLHGSPESLIDCKKLLQRVMTHCRWGVNEAKIKKLIQVRAADSAFCRLSPIGVGLPQFQKVLSGMVHSAGVQLSIGKDKGNDLTIADPLVSRIHVVLEFEAERGAIYIIDCSTNGAFLNGIRLPGKKSGKVLVSHGDELLLKDPRTPAGQEFGYIINIDYRGVKGGLKLTAPRRIRTAEDHAPVSFHELA